MESSSSSIRSVPANYGYLWLKYSWEIAKRNYGLCLGIGITIGLIAFMLGKGKIFGTLLSPIVMVPISAGIMQSAQRWTRGEQTEWVDIFNVFSDSPLLLRLVPLIILTALLGVAGEVTNFLVPLIGQNPAEKGMFVAIRFFAALVVGVLTAYSVPQIVFKKRNFFQTIGYNIDAIFKNIPAHIYFAILAILLFVSSIMLLLLPFILFTIPLMMPGFYLLYATIFEGLDLPQGLNLKEMTEEKTN